MVEKSRTRTRKEDVGEEDFNMFKEEEGEGRSRHHVEDMGGEDDGQSSNNLRFFPYTNHKLTRSVGTLNLSLSSDINISTPHQQSNNKQLGDITEENVSERTVNEYINRWSPFNDRSPSTPVTLKRTASKSELSPFVNDPDILKRWKYKMSNFRLKEHPWSPSHFPQQQAHPLPPASLPPGPTSGVPDPSAFSGSTRLVSKIAKSFSSLYPQKLSTPDTPVKKSPMLEESRISTSMDDSPRLNMTRETTLFQQSPSLKAALQASVNTSPLSAGIYSSNSIIDTNNVNTNGNINNNNSNSNINTDSDTNNNNNNNNNNNDNDANTDNNDNYNNGNNNGQQGVRYPANFHTNRYKKIKKSRNSIILKNSELTNSLQQFTNDLYGTDSSNYGGQNGNVVFLSDLLSKKPDGGPSAFYECNNSTDTTPTRRKSMIGARNKGHMSSIQVPPPSSSSISNKLEFAGVPDGSIESSPLQNKKHEMLSPDSHLFEKFKNVYILGEGQFSRVYQVTFAQNNRKYAVKSIQVNKRNSVKRILQEINLLDEVNKTNLDQEGREYVIDFISSWKYQNAFYLMTEYCENGNLDGFLQEHIITKNTRLEDWRIWKILVELSLALRFIHESCHIVHLDLKPVNVMITFEGNLKLGDFGMAAHLPLEDVAFENEGDREYIAPEIIFDCIYDFKADIFSLGLMIVEIAANVVLPDNGNAWHKLRSGDLSDAGGLSCTDIDSESLFSGGSKVDTNITSISDYPNNADKHLNNIRRNRPSIPPWVPKFLIDGESLERMVKWMIDPNYARRPSADDILHTEECIYVEMTRQAGAIIQEDDYGPKPDFFAK